MSFVSRHFTPSSTNGWIKTACAGLIPILIGLTYNLVPRYLPGTMVLLQLLFVIVPVVQLLLWFFIGKTSVSKLPHPFWGWLVQNWLGILSLLLFIWQFGLIPEQARNGAIAIFCQQFSAGLSLITYFIGTAFQSDILDVGFTEALIMQVSGLIFMLVSSLLGVAIPRMSAASAARRAEKEKAHRAEIRAKAQGTYSAGKKK